MDSFHLRPRTLAFKKRNTTEDNEEIDNYEDNQFSNKESVEFKFDSSYNNISKNK